MVYIVGVDHMVQYNGPVPEPIRVEFRSYIIGLCRGHDIKVIAEEFSEEALREVYHATAETALEAARTLGLEHRYCDPGEQELAALGIPFFGELLEKAAARYNAPPSYIMDHELRKKVNDGAVSMAKKYWRIREQYWYDQLQDILGMNILFICGHEHADRFMSLLMEHGHQCEIVDQFWKKELFEDYNAIGLI